MIAMGELSFREVCSDIYDSLMIIMGWCVHPHSCSSREGMRGGGESGGRVGMDGGEVEWGGRWRGGGWGGRAAACKAQTGWLRRGCT